MILNNTQANIFKVNGGIADNFANRPAANGSFYIFYSIDTQEIYYDNGAWVLLGSSGGGGVNIYNNNGTLTGNRTLSGSGYNLDFLDISIIKFSNYPLDYGYYQDQGTIKLGDYANNYITGMFFEIDASNRIIKSSNQGNDIGLKLNFAINQFIFGDSNVNQTFILIDTNAYTITFEEQNGTNGLLIDFTNDLFKLGQLTGGNTTYFEIDDINETLQTQSNSNLDGIYFDFANEIFKFGQFVSGNGVHININGFAGVDTLQTIYSNNNQGLDLQFNNRIYNFGQLTANNRTKFTINDVLETTTFFHNGVQKGLKLDYAQRRYQLGQLSANNLTSFNIEDNGGFIYCLYQNNGIGFSFQSNVSNYQYGQISGGNLSKLIINDLTNQIYLSNANVFNGWFCDFNTKIYRFGQINGGNLTRYVIDDNNSYPLGVEGNNIVSPTSGGSSGQHLKIKINGIDYKIALLNP